MKCYNRKWIKFKVYPEVQGNKVEAAYALNADGQYSIKLITKVPRGDYYGVLNDAGQEFDDNVLPAIKSDIDPVFESLYDALYRLVGKRLIDVGYVERRLFDMERNQLGHNKTHWYCWDKVKNSPAVKKSLQL